MCLENLERVVMFVLTVDVLTCALARLCVFVCGLCVYFLLQDWDLNKSLSLPQMYSSARLAVFFAGAASLYFLGSAVFGDSKKKSH